MPVDWPDRPWARRFHNDSRHRFAGLACARVLSIGADVQHEPTIVAVDRCRRGNIVLIAALFGWVNVCLLVRAQIKAFREKEFVRAAQALGASPWYIIRRHLIPNSISPIIIGFVLAIPLAMMLEASLSFLGIGVPPPTPSWGQMISIGLNFMFFYWHMAVFPTAALAITVLATTLFGDGLRDALDPTLKGR